MTYVVEVKTSDLFQQFGRNFNFENRLLNQSQLVERINEANKDILNPNAIAITHLAEEIKEFCDDHIASITFIEYALEQLKTLGVTLT